jgi:hypothetical protein
MQVLKNENTNRFLKRKVFGFLLELFSNLLKMSFEWRVGIKRRKIEKRDFVYFQKYLLISQLGISGEKKRKIYSFGIVQENRKVDVEGYLQRFAC